MQTIPFDISCNIECVVERNNDRRVTLLREREREREREAFFKKMCVVVVQVWELV
jgi:hypothetical protein